MIDREAPHATPAAPALAPEGRTVADEMLSIATGQRVISREQNFEGVVMGWFHMLITEQMIRGWNATRDFRDAYLPMHNNLRAFIYFLTGKAKDEKSRREHLSDTRQFFAGVKAARLDERIPLLWNYAGYALPKTGIGMPQEVPEGDWDVDLESELARLEPQILVLNEAAVADGILGDRDGRKR